MNKGVAKTQKINALKRIASQNRLSSSFLVPKSMVTLMVTLTLSHTFGDFPFFVIWMRSTQLLRCFSDGTTGRRWRWPLKSVTCCRTKMWRWRAPASVCSLTGRTRHQVFHPGQGGGAVLRLCRTGIASHCIAALPALTREGKSYLVIF